MSELEAVSKRKIPAYDNEAGEREIDTRGKSLLGIINESLNEYRTAIKTELAALEKRVEDLEKKL